MDSQRDYSKEGSFSITCQCGHCVHTYSYNEKDIYLHVFRTETWFAVYCKNPECQKYRNLIEKYFSPNRRQSVFDNKKKIPGIVQERIKKRPDSIISFIYFGCEEKSIAIHVSEMQKYEKSSLKVRLFGREFFAECRICGRKKNIDQWIWHQEDDIKEKIRQIVSKNDTRGKVF
jgi:hypothetical protein